MFISINATFIIQVAKRKPLRLPFWFRQGIEGSGMVGETSGGYFNEPVYEINLY